jgi:hypothetical protein
VGQSLGIARGSIGSSNWLHPSLTNLVGLQLVFYYKVECVSWIKIFLPLRREHLKDFATEGSQVCLLLPGAQVEDLFLDRSLLIPHPIHTKSDSD